MPYHYINIAVPKYNFNITSLDLLKQSLLTENS
jgi:hypothetical protein